MGAGKNTFVQEPAEKTGDARLVERAARLVSEGEDVLASELPVLFARLLGAACLDELAGPARLAAWARAQAGRGFAALWVQPCNAGRVAWELAQAGDATPVCAPLGYPQGQALADELCFSAALMMACGAGELAVVANHGALLEGDDAEAAAPVAAVLSTVDAGPDDEGEGCGCGHDHDDGCGCGCDHDHDDGCDHDDACDCADGAPLVKAVLRPGALGGEGLCRAVDLVSGMGAGVVVLAPHGGADPAPRDVRLACATVEPGVRVEVLAERVGLEGALDLLEAGADRVTSPRAPAVLDELAALAGGAA